MSQKKQPRPRRTYTTEFKQQIGDLYRTGKRKCDILREYDIASSLLSGLPEPITPVPLKKRIIVHQSRKNCSNSEKKISDYLWRMIF